MLTAVVRECLLAAMTHTHKRERGYSAVVVAAVPGERGGDGSVSNSLTVNQLMTRKHLLD